MQQHEPPYTATHTTIFHRTRGPIRMLRAEAAAAVARDLSLSFGPWTGGAERDVSGGVDLPHNWATLPIEQRRALMTAMRLPPGNRGEGCQSHVATISECLTHRQNLRWVGAMGLAQW
jgi:hypothetical protein